MRKIELLDCTLRDGGYVNDNTFGYYNIQEIIKKLEDANIDIIECGYLKDTKDEYSIDVTEYKNSKEVIEQKLIKQVTNYTLMLLGETYKIENLPENKANIAIRMSFHKHSLQKAIEYAKIIIKKGYKLFLQPTVIMQYKDDEIVGMLEEFNKLDLMGVAIVDTFGQMLPKDIIRLTKIFDKYLRDDIKLAFHAHNNFQLAFSNAVSFIENSKESRNIVIDTSLCGMGRGAGNLPTELIANYLNENYGTNYNISNLLEVNDTIIEKIKKEHQWGYSLPYYLSAKYACHPSYVLYLLNKKMLDSSDIDKVLQMISSKKTSEYDSEYIEELYTTYCEKNIDDQNSYNAFNQLINDKNILLIGPGQTIVDYKNNIDDFIEHEKPYIITINNSNLFRHNATFYSNKKRYNAISHNQDEIELLTSNISIDEQPNRIIFDYRKSLPKKQVKSDSALLILLTILEQANVKQVYLAGFDGYTNLPSKNFYNSEVAYLLDLNYIKELNETLKKNIELFQKNMNIVSITPSLNIKGGSYENNCSHTSTVRIH